MNFTSKRAWTQEERYVFVKCEKCFRKDFQKYEEFLPGRSKQQIKSFYYNWVSGDEKKRENE